MRPAEGGGATPMLPKNGFNGISTPPGNVAIIRLASSGMISACRPGSQFSRRKPLHPL